VRNWALSSLFVISLAANSFAEPNVLKATAVPEPSLLLALGTGLVGIATLIRRYFTE